MSSLIIQVVIMVILISLVLTKVSLLILLVPKL